MDNYSEFYKSFRKEDGILNLNNRVDTISRMDIMQPPSSEMQFKMYEKLSIDNKATDYRGALNGEYETTLLSNLFFSAENIQIIQNGIRAGVYKRSNGMYIVGNQKCDELKIIMRSIFLQYAKNQPTHISSQIETLNTMVLNYAVNQVYGEAEGYMKYKRDASTMYTPIAHPVMSKTNDKQLELKKWF